MSILSLLFLNRAWSLSSRGLASFHCLDDSCFFRMFSECEDLLQALCEKTHMNYFWMNGEVVRRYMVNLFACFLFIQLTPNNSECYEFSLLFVIEVMWELFRNRFAKSVCAHKRPSHVNILLLRGSSGFSLSGTDRAFIRLLPLTNESFDIS